nr:hypothetical protein [Burkholderia sp. Bp9031]
MDDGIVIEHACDAAPAFDENPVMFRPCRRHADGDKLRPSCVRSAPSRRCSRSSGRSLPDSTSMSYWRKFILVVLLALSLPIQSFATVSMQCAGVVVAAPHAGNGVSAHDAAASHAMSGAHGGGHAQDDRARHASSCSACGACCFGTGMSEVPAVSVPTGVGIAAASSRPSSIVVSFLTGGIDRPPRRNPV